MQDSSFFTAWQRLLSKSSTTVKFSPISPYCSLLRRKGHVVPNSQTFNGIWITNIREASSQNHSPSTERKKWNNTEDTKTRESVYCFKLKTELDLVFWIELSLDWALTAHKAKRKHLMQREQNRATGPLKHLMETYVQKQPARDGGKWVHVVFSFITRLMP